MDKAWTVRHSGQEFQQDESEVCLRIWREFILAAGFLTRLAPARITDAEMLGQSLRWFPLVGLYLGVILALPFLFGLARGHPWFQAWLWLGLSMVLTRGLHWDGWADLCDAWGSGAQGERFWEVIKDSRTGAFGTMGLFMGLSGFLILLLELFQCQALGLLIWAPVLGRSAAVILAWQVRDLGRPGLAEMFLWGATGRRALLAAAAALVLGMMFVPWTTVLVSGLLSAGGVLFLIRLAHSRNGVNGDFLGAAIIWGELSAFIGWMLAGA